MDVTIQKIYRHNEHILSFELVNTHGELLPAFQAGAHIDVHLGNQLIRQYSLANCSSEQHRYVIGVLNDPLSRGGSKFIHEQLREGQQLKISEPRNLFALVPETEYAYLCAGGIGITPILAMAKELKRNNQSFQLLYFVKTRASIAFQQDLEALGDSVHIHIDDEPETHILLNTVFASPHIDHHIYVCGPDGFMNYVIHTADTLSWPSHQVHKEHFSAQAIDTSQDGSFEIEILKTGQRIHVAADQSAAQALEHAGICIPLSCEQGICGTCLVNVVEGEIDHRDMYLTEEEQAANDQFTPCCSRAKSQRIIIDV
ncbi:PDR/VanB family oxidoreductase [Acinetobacter sp. YH16032]|uniref:PDR/VanB family oxidoreductase n=1 Tax=Acinetobacter sp. YH16032 TaxID=2601181 RepID=UPI0015D382E5|nr:PDR/VanB family oxidoreductase [Acinetobacter sp. YH16032]